MSAPRASVSMRRLRAGPVRAWWFAWAVAGCARVPATSGASSADPQAPPRAIRGSLEPTPDALLRQAEDALQADDPAAAVALFGRFLAAAPSDHPNRSQAYLGLAAGHEKLADCTSAVVAYDAFLQAFPASRERVTALLRRGACEAELGAWSASAASFEIVAATPEQLPSVTIEALARQGYALFEARDLEAADQALVAADAVYERAQREQSERFSSYYFVGMARFYRAAIVHRQFREVEIELPESVMEAAFKRKLELLVRSQDLYNHAIAAKHMFWVSASGYQLGQLFGEFYDALMHAPVPTWLDARQKRVYYAELKTQLRPVLDKAIWVFEKNLATARRLGYESPFIAKTEDQLAALQAALLSEQDSLGRPQPELVSDARGGPTDGGPRADADNAGELRAPTDAMLYVPEPTPL